MVMAKAIKGPGTWMALGIRKLASLKKTHLSVNWCYDRAWCLDLGVFCFNLGSFSRNFWHFFGGIFMGKVMVNHWIWGYPLSAIPWQQKMALSDRRTSSTDASNGFHFFTIGTMWKRNCGKDHILGQHSERREISNQRLKNCDLILWS